LPANGSGTADLPLIEFVGAIGGLLNGLGGTTFGAVRMEAGNCP
jgi:hypothetical protein